MERRDQLSFSRIICNAFHTLPNTLTGHSVRGQVALSRHGELVGDCVLRHFKSTTRCLLISRWLIVAHGLPLSVRPTLWSSATAFGTAITSSVNKRGRDGPFLAGRARLPPNARLARTRSVGRAAGSG